MEGSPRWVGASGARHRAHRPLRCVLFQLGNIHSTRRRIGERTEEPRNASLKFDNHAARFWRPTAPCRHRFPATSGPQVLAGLSAGLLVLPARRLRLLHLRGPTIEDSNNDYLVAHHPILTRSRAAPKTTRRHADTPTLQNTAQEHWHRPRRQQGRCDRGTRPADGAVLAMYSTDVRPNHSLSSHDPDRGEARLPRQDAGRFLTLVPIATAAIFPPARRSRSSPRLGHDLNAALELSHRCSPARAAQSTRSSVTTGNATP